MSCNKDDRFGDDDYRIKQSKALRIYVLKVHSMPFQSHQPCVPIGEVRSYKQLAYHLPQSLTRLYNMNLIRLPREPKTKKKRDHVCQNKQANMHGIKVRRDGS